MLALKMLFLLEREEFPLKKIKANTRPIKTLSSCYHFGTVLKYSQPKLAFIKNPFPSCTGDHNPDTDPEFLQPFKKEKSKHCLDITWRKPRSDWVPVCRNDVWWQGQRGFSSPPPPALPISSQEGAPRALGHSSSVHRGFLQRAKFWFMLYGTKTTGMLFV